MLYFLTITLTLSTLVHAISVNRKSGRIMNSHEAPEGKYPFMASLSHMEVACDFKKTWGHECSGTVINDNTILTCKKPLQNICLRF